MRAAIVITLLAAIVLALVFALQTGGGGSPQQTLPGTESPYEPGPLTGERARTESIDSGRVELPTQTLPADLPPDASISGRVIDAASGGSLAMADVWLEESLSEPIDGDLMVVTPGDGSFVLPYRRSEGGALAAGAIREGYLTVRRTLRSRDFGADGHAQNFDLALWPLEATARITGRVVASDGSSVTGSQVTVREQEDPTRSPENGDPSHLEVGVDGTGRFELAPLPPGTHDVEVQCEGFDAQRISAVSLPQGSDTDLGTIVLTPTVGEQAETAVLFGTVLEADGSTADAAVLHHPGYTDEVRVEADASGFYELRVPAGDRQTIAIEIPGQPTFRFERSFEPGERVEYHHRNPGGEHSIGGIVVDGATPVRELEVWCALRYPGPPGARRGRLELRTTTEEDGRFHLEGIDQKTVDLVLEWYHGSFRNIVVEDLEVDREDHRLQFPVPRNISISGVVLSLTGEPVAGARIAPASGPATELPAARATSGPDGRYRVEVPLTSQSALSLDVSKTGYRSASRRLLLREVEGEGSIAWNPVLHTDAELAIVRGRVTDESGRPLDSVQCMFEQLDVPLHTRQRWRASSDSEGNYESPGLFPGRILVTFRHPERIAAEEEIVLPTSGRARVDMSLSRPVRGDRTLFLVLPNSSPAAEVKYSITCTVTRAHQSGTADIRGSVFLESWPAAETEITVLVDGRHPQQTATVVFPADSMTNRMTLRRGNGTIAGRVVSPEGYPVVNEYVVLREREGPGLRVYQEEFAGQDGEFRFTNLPEAVFDLDVSNDPRTRQEARPGDTVTLQFPAGG